ncbi:hypothetical protein BH11PAT1_BH11PAT1_4390 [soil metagenome]
MANNKISGDEGENEVVALIPCPNCHQSLMLLPKSFPLNDLQCTACHFRAQVKTNICPPKDEILGAGWDILDKVIKAGYLIPPLIANFKWVKDGEDKQEIRFYPFIGTINLKTRILSPTARRANYKMFNYIGLQSLPYFVLYTK